jgi:hypothetical protein
MKTMETTDEVSSHPGGKGAWEDRRASEHPLAREKSRPDWENGLQICVEGTKSRKRLTPVVGKKSNGKSRIKFPIRSWLRQEEEVEASEQR